MKDPAFPESFSDSIAELNVCFQVCPKVDSRYFWPPTVETTLSIKDASYCFHLGDAWPMPIRLGLDPAIHQAGDEGDITRQPVQAGNGQHRPPPYCQIERGGELGPVDLPANLDLCELGHDATAAMAWIDGV